MFQNFVGGGVDVNWHMKIQSQINYEQLISVDNLFAAWKEFLNGKRKKSDVQFFAHSLIDNILQLHDDLANKTYSHGGYYCFNISDPKPRSISKASVRDRLIHHAIYRKFYPFFDRTFIGDSYSCRVNKGTHRATKRLLAMFYKVSRNDRQKCWVLKCDIRKFFASIGHDILLEILKNYIPDKDVIWLFKKIIKSFSTSDGVGLPLGNLTSQLFVNVYMNEFDQFVKHKLKSKYYIRYADDFIFLAKDKEELIKLLPLIESFLKHKLRLSLHPNKITLKSFASGIDFLGWVNFPTHRVLRTSTKKRILRSLSDNISEETLRSYLGLLKYGNTTKIKNIILTNYWLSKEQEN